MHLLGWPHWYIGLVALNISHESSILRIDPFHDFVDVFALLRPKASDITTGQALATKTASIDIKLTTVHYFVQVITTTLRQYMQILELMTLCKLGVKSQVSINGVGGVAPLRH